MTPKFEIEVTGQPVPKARPRVNTRTGHVYTPKRSKDYETRLKIAAWTKARQMGWKCVTGPFAMRIICANTGMMDLDNVAKQCADALEKAGIFTNDKNCDVLHVERDIHAPEPYLFVEVMAL